MVYNKISMNPKDYFVFGQNHDITKNCERQVTIMRSITQKTASAILLAAFALTASSCGSAGTSTDQPDTQTIAETTAEPEKVYDLGGYTLNVAKIAQDNIAWVLVSFGVKEENGEILNDTIYARNQSVTEKNNFTITETEISGGTISTIRNLVNAGDDEYQVVFDQAATLSGAASEGILYDLRTIDSLELDKASWNQNMISSLSVGDRVYLVGGDITVSDEDSVEVLVYNTSYARDLQLEDLYQVVRDGKWTVDKMYEVCKLAVNDVNGDSKMDLEDSYGTLANYDGISAMLISCGTSAISKNANGEIEITADSERFAEAFDKLSRIYTEPTYHSYDGVTVELQVSRLETNKNLFVNAVTSFARRFLRDVKTDFGFLPTPKLDEEQDKYISAAVQSTCVLAIPASVEDAETAGLALQLLADGSGDITKAYYDICLQSKYTRDEESYEMLQISIENIEYNVGYIYNKQFADLHNALMTELTKGTNNIASVLASKRSAAEEAILKYIG